MNDVYREAKAIKGKYRVVYKWKARDPRAESGDIGRVVAEVFDTRGSTTAYGKFVKTITSRQMIDRVGVEQAQDPEMILYRTMERMFIDAKRAAEREIASRYIDDTVEMFSEQLVERFNRFEEAN